MCKELPETAEDSWRQLDSKDADPMGLPGSGYPFVVKKERSEPLLSWGPNLELIWTLCRSHKLDGVFCRETLG